MKVAKKRKNYTTQCAGAKAIKANPQKFS